MVETNLVILLSFVMFDLVAMLVLRRAVYIGVLVGLFGVLAGLYGTFSYGFGVSALNGILCLFVTFFSGLTMFVCSLGLDVSGRLFGKR